MLCIIDTYTTDPYWNLAAEEYLLTNFSEPVFRLWRNRDSIIVGKNQNTFAEINLDFVKENGISVVRRLTGGGAVFHDLGNVNYTFIDNRCDNESTDEMFRRFTSPIITSLNKLGVNAQLSGRNDLLIDDRKFSGNAVCIHNGRLLQHGTLLFQSSMNNLAQALQSHEEKFIGKAVKSNRSRVTNISSHLTQPMSIEEFFTYIAGFITENNDCVRYQYSPEDIEAIRHLMETKYRTDEWNYGKSPKYSCNRRFRFPSGIIDLYFNVEKGILTDFEIHGDYFFRKSTEELAEILKGTPYDKEKITDCLKNVAIGEYFSGIDTNQFVSLLFT